MALTDIAIRNAKFVDKPFKLSDGEGMYLFINAIGKYWRLDYRYLNKRKTLSLGKYPTVSLAAARQKRADAKKMLSEEIDPLEHKKIIKLTRLENAANSFEAVGLEWFAKNRAKWVESHSEKIIARLKNDIFPWIGSRPIADLTAPEILSVLRRIENRGAIETAHRALQNCGQIFRYAIATGRASRDICADLRGALPPAKQKHHASITEPQAVGALIRAIRSYQGSFVTACALRLAPLVFLRPGELRHAEWSEIDLEAGEWRIPAEKMKMRTLHIVPLSTQAVAVLNEIRPLTGHRQYVFPSVRTSDRPMSENTILGALRRLGYEKEEMTGHGFRSMASTLLNENGWNSDAIERQLAHSERNSVRAAYNYAELLPERRKMMQWWADYLDSLAKGADIITLRSPSESYANAVK
jgi:integrase